MTTICIDLGGTIVKGGIFSEGNMVESGSIPSRSGGDFSLTMTMINDFILGLLTRSGTDIKKIKGIGLSIPGIVNVKQNKVLSINKKHEGAIRYDFNKWADKQFETRIVMENDARAALVGEWQYGAGRGYDNIVMMTLGTGVGGAAMINGELLYGKHYQAGCLGGHFTINYQGDICTCGNIGCVEAEASSWKLEQLITNYPDLNHKVSHEIEKTDFKKLFELYAKGDKSTEKIINHCLKVWSSGIVSLIHAYDPELVILGGGIMKSKDYILPFIREWVEKHAWTPSEQVKIKVAQFSSSPALIGMNHLVRKNQK